MLVPVITTILNLSLDAGTFLSLFKQAVVTPPLKKPSLNKESLSNYRPIANLSFLSKFTERIVKDHITHHFSTNSMFNSFQSAYTKQHSTETTLIALYDDLIRAVDKQEVTFLPFLTSLQRLTRWTTRFCCYAYLCGLVSDAMSSLGFLHICQTELLLSHAQTVNHHPHDL